METESSSISGIQGKHKKTLIKADCLSMLLNNFYPANKGNWQIIMFWKVHGRGVLANISKLKKNFLEDLVYL